MAVNTDPPVNKSSTPGRWQINTEEASRAKRNTRTRATGSNSLSSLCVWPEEGGDVCLDIFSWEKNPSDCLLVDGSSARAQLISWAETVWFLTNVRKDFEFLKPVAKK